MGQQTVVKTDRYAVVAIPDMAPEERLTSQLGGLGLPQAVTISRH